MNPATLEKVVPSPGSRRVVPPGVPSVIQSTLALSKAFGSSEVAKTRRSWNGTRKLITDTAQSVSG